MQYWTTDEFINGRARLQRVTDAKFFSGWVEDFRSTSLCIETSAPVTILPGDKFAFQLYGRSRDAIFIGEALRAAVNEVPVLTEPDETPAHQYRFKVTGEITFVKSSENARFLARGATASLELHGESINATVSDYSSQGLGLVLQAELPREAVTAIQMKVGGLDLQCVGQVRYCRPAEKGTFRAGIKILRFNAKSQERWDRLMEGPPPVREAA